MTEPTTTPEPAPAPREQALAALVVSWLQADGWDVYQEVQHFDSPRICDIVAWKAGVSWAIEVKGNAGLELLEQALNYRGSAHRISIAAPMPLSPRLAEFLPHLCVELGLGLFDLSSGAAVSMEWPRFDSSVKSIGFKLRPEHMKLAKAGTQSGGRAGGTGETAAIILEFVKAHHGSSLEEIVAATNLRWGKGAGAVARLREMLKKDQIPGVRVRKFRGTHCLYPDDSPLVSGAR